MGVEISESMSGTLSALENFQSVLDDMVDIMVDELKGNGANSNALIKKNFEHNAQNQRVYTPLTAMTKKRKKGKQPYIMNASGRLKRETLGTMKGKFSGKKIRMSAKVPTYGTYHQPRGSDGSPEMGAVIKGVKVRRFFDIKKNDFKRMSKVMELSFQKALEKNKLTESI